MSETLTNGQSEWTPDKDAAIREGFEKGLSARIIADQLGVTRNAILGRAYRMRIGGSVESKRSPIFCHPNLSKPKTLKPPRVRHANAKLYEEGFADRVKDLREIGLKWHEIADIYKVSTATVRKRSIKLGILLPKTPVRFTEQEWHDIASMWRAYVPLEDIAEKLNRSFGVIRQCVLKLQKQGSIGGRDGTKTRLLKHYGEQALEAGATPAEAIRNINAAKKAAFTAAISQAEAAKQKRYKLAIEKMKADIESGVDRNAAIFAARAEGVTLEQIAVEFGITRERVRQLCVMHAEELALKALLT
jgi:hypothetical protein